MSYLNWIWQCHGGDVWQLSTLSHMHSWCTGCLMCDRSSLYPIDDLGILASQFPWFYIVPKSSKTHSVTCDWTDEHSLKLDSFQGSKTSIINHDVTSVTFLLGCCVMVLAYLQWSVVRCSIHKIVMITIQGLLWLLNAWLYHIFWVSIPSGCFQQDSFLFTHSHLWLYSSPCQMRTPPLSFMRTLGLIAFTLTLTEKCT